jgi:hypothetical protein
MTFFLFVAANSASLTLDDFAVGVISSSRYFSGRLSPMSHAWFELVPEVHIYLD